MSPEDILVAQIQAVRRVGENRESTRVAEAYSAALQNRNLTAISNILHPQFNYVTPTGETQGKESFLATLQKVLNHVQKIDETAHYEAGNQTAHIYSMFFAPSPNPVSTIHILTHDEGKITKVQEIDDTKFLPDHFKQENKS